MKAGILVLVAVSLGATSCVAQDAVKADSAHYSVILENEHVRVLDIHYPPHSKGNMHSHPCSVTVFLRRRPANDSAGWKEQGGTHNGRASDMGRRGKSPAGKSLRPAVSCHQNRIEKSPRLHEDKMNREWGLIELTRNRLIASDRLARFACDMG